MAAHDPASPPAVRAILALLVDEGGIVAREAVAKALGSVEREQRKSITKLGVRIGALDLFMPDVLKPEARRWRTALKAAAAGEAMPALPGESVVVLPAPPNGALQLLQRLGFRALGPQMLRVDMAERLARHAHEARGSKDRPVVDQALATSIGLQPQAVARLMRDLGFRAADADGEWVWRGPSRPRRQDQRPPDPSHAFAALAGLRRG